MEEEEEPRRRLQEGDDARRCRRRRPGKARKGFHPASPLRLRDGVLQARCRSSATDRVPKLPRRPHDHGNRPTSEPRAPPTSIVPPTTEAAAPASETTPRPPPPHTDIINRLRGSKDPSFRPKQAPLAGSAGSQIWAGKTPAASRAAATRDARSGTSKSRRRRLREAPLPPPSRRPCHPPASRAKPEHKRSRHQQPIQVPPRP